VQWLFLILLSAISLLSAADGGLRLAPDAEIAEWVRTKIQAPMHTHCGECHAGAMADGGFSIDRYERILGGGFDYPIGIRPWRPARSPVLQMMQWKLDDDLRMPPKQQAPAEFIADVERWIAMGAPWPDVAAVTPAPTPPLRPSLLARLHPVAVHLPLGAMIVALLLEVIASLQRSPLHAGTRWALVLALIGAAFAITSGLQMPESQIPAQREAHEQAGWILGALLALATPAAWRATVAPRWTWPARALIAGAVGAALVTGHLGGAMTWGAGWLF